MLARAETYVSTTATEIGSSEKRNGTTAAVGTYVIFVAAAAAAAFAISDIAPGFTVGGATEPKTGLIDVNGESLVALPSPF